MIRRRQSTETRPTTIVAAGVILALLLSSAPAAAEHPLDAFVRASLDLSTDRRDSLAQRFNPAQLPLLAACVAEDDTLTPSTLTPLYRAFTRWHYWTGGRWDPGGQGLWRIDTRTLPIGDRLGGRTLAAHASLELVQLLGLARMAEHSGNTFDALVWWNDYARLRDRIDLRLLDGARGVHTDLDSLGAQREQVGISSAIALATGLETAAWTARETHWELWSGRRVDDPTTLGSVERVHALERAQALHGWGRDAGLRLLEPELTAALILHGIERLEDVGLTRTVRDGLVGAGFPTSPEARLRLGSFAPELDLDALHPRPLERARVAIAALDGMGVLSREESRSVPAHVDSVVASGDEQEIDALVAELLALLNEWRALDPSEHRYTWKDRRRERAPMSTDGAAFRWNEIDTTMWFERALGLITEDIVAHHLRPRPQSVWRAHIEPRVIGRGDETELVVHPTRQVPASGEPIEVGLLWTDGQSIVPAGRVELQPTDRVWSAPIGSAPDRNGLWHLVVEGLPESLRLPPAVSVVDPLQLRVLPLPRKGRVLSYRIEVSSHVQSTIPARVDVTVPLSFDADPATSHEVMLEPGVSESWDLVLRPADDDGPALHPVRFQLFDDQREVASTETVAAIPMRWLRLGPLRPQGDAPIDYVYDPDRSIDLAQRFRGVRRTVGWNRLPSSRIATDGWTKLADTDDPAGVHYVFTAFTTGSRESIVSLESNGPAVARVNGSILVRTPDWGGRDEAEVSFGAGTNFLLVKVENRAGTPCEVRVNVRDIDGEPLRGVGNTLEQLLDQYAYLTRSRDPDDEEDRTLGRDSMRLVPFTFRADQAASVSVVGSFNGWSPTATRMVKRDDGAWQVKVRLQPGRFEYKFAVDGSNWIQDPSNPEAVNDGFGGRNSVLVVE